MSPRKAYLTGKQLYENLCGYIDVMTCLPDILDKVSNNVELGFSNVIVSHRFNVIFPRIVSPTKMNRMVLPVLPGSRPRDTAIFCKIRGAFLLLQAKGMDMLDALKIWRGLHLYLPRYL